MHPVQKNAPPSSPQASQRLAALDAFRGLTILGMVLVNNPGSRKYVYEPLTHADWFGWTPTDLIFPAFLFMVGTSLAYSLCKHLTNERVTLELYRSIIRRTIVLLAIGVLLNFGDDLFAVLFGHASADALSTLRLPGVLQRIAIVYLLTSLVVVHFRVPVQLVLAASLLLGYWAVLSWFPDPQHIAYNLTPEENVVRIVDRAVIGDQHLFAQARSEPTDPEGLLSTLPALVNALMGYWTGLLIQRQPSRWRAVAVLLACGLAAIVVGWTWSESLPVIKKLWTGSFVLISGGIAMTALAFCLVVFDLLDGKRWARPLEIAGVNAIFVYVGSQLVAMLLASFQIGGDSARDWLYNQVFRSWIADPWMASLTYALAFVAAWWLVLWQLTRRGWTFRI